MQGKWIFPLLSKIGNAPGGTLKKGKVQAYLGREAHRLVAAIELGLITGTLVRLGGRGRPVTMLRLTEEGWALYYSTLMEAAK